MLFSHGAKSKTLFDQTRNKLFVFAPFSREKGFSWSSVKGLLALQKYHLMNLILAQY